jgi:4-aminobutyrate--pyruvate transaminase
MATHTCTPPHIDALAQRGVGLIGALELVAPESRADEMAPGKLGAQMNATMLRNGLISRNMLDAMAFCPPLIVTANDVREIIQITARSLDELAAEMGGVG